MKLVLWKEIKDNHTFFVSPQSLCYSAINIKKTACDNNHQLMVNYVTPE